MAAHNRVKEEFVQLMFDPNLFGKMHCVAYASGTGTNFEQAVQESRTPGSNYSVDMLITDKLWKKRGHYELGTGHIEEQFIGAANLAHRLNIHHVFIDGYAECGSWQEAQKTTAGIREYERRAQMFNSTLYGAVREYEQKAGIVFDAAVLAGYMRLFKGALLRRFNNRAVNVHPAELDKFNEDGTRKYIGDKAVFDALSAGEERTRSSIILLDPETDAGAILVSGPWLEYTGPRPVPPEAAEDHQGKQKAASDWPALRFALRAIANGEFGLHKRKFHPDGNPVVVYKGEEMPYQGYEMGNNYKEKWEQ